MVVDWGISEMDKWLSLALWDGIFVVLGMFAAMLVGKKFDHRWFLAAIVLFNLNVVLVLDVFGIYPTIDAMTGIGNGAFNWTGKILAFIFSLVILATGKIRWAEAGVTLSQSPQAKYGWGVVIFFILLSIVAGIFLPDEIHSAETIAYQLTMPSLEEEIFHRGILLYCLVRACGAGREILWANFGIAAAISTIMFTIIHALFWSDTGLFFALDAFLFAGVFGLILTWLRLNTGSIVAPIILHSAINTIWRLF